MKTFIATVLFLLVFTLASAECKKTHTLTYPDGTQVTYCLDE